MLGDATTHNTSDRPESHDRNRREAQTSTWQLNPENLLFGLFIVGLAWVPFWLGSNRPVAWAINATLFPGLAAVYELSLLWRGARHPVALRTVGASAILFTCAVAWAFLQNATWVPAGWQHPIWQLAAESLDQPVAGSISVDRDLTALALLRLITAASVLWLALQLCRDAKRARFFVWSLVAIVFVYSIVGLFAMGFMPYGGIFDEIDSPNFVTSTFVNKNHFGTFAGMGLVAAAALILRCFRHDLDRDCPWRLRAADIVNTIIGPAAVPLILTFVILAALLMSGSRGAIISSGLGITALLAYAWRGASRLSRTEVALAVVGIAAVVAVILAFGDKFSARMEVDGIYDQGRLDVYTATLRSIVSSPLLGYGYGTFVAAFPMFHDSTVGAWDFLVQAHNTYLEVFQGLGLVFGTMLIASVVILVWACGKSALKNGRTATVIAAAVSVLVGVHALVDFSLQIQAITLTYMAFLGAGAAPIVKPQ